MGTNLYPKKLKKLLSDVGEGKMEGTLDAGFVCAGSSSEPNIIWGGGG